MVTFYQFYDIYSIDDLLRGHLRSLILAPIESAYMSSSSNLCDHDTSVVTLVLCYRVSEILEPLYAESCFFDTPSLFWPKFPGVPLRVDL